MALAINLTKRKEKTVMARLDELEGILTGLSTQVAKIATEVQTLKDLLANTQPGAQAALDNLTVALQVVDDLNVDALFGRAGGESGVLLSAPPEPVTDTDTEQPA